MCEPRQIKRKKTKIKRVSRGLFENSLDLSSSQTSCEPLKNKVNEFEERQQGNDPATAIDIEFFRKEDVVSAVQWLKTELYDLYHKVGKVEVWTSESRDVLMDLTEDFVTKKIDEAFEDAKE